MERPQICTHCTVLCSNLLLPKLLLHTARQIKAKLRSRETYQDFLKCLNLYASEVITKSELINLVHDLIGRFPDLAVSSIWNLTTLLA